MVPGGDLVRSGLLSGERFRAVYQLSTDEPETWARHIVVEQTIEFPPEYVAPGDIRDHLIGRIESLRELSTGRFEAVISYAVECAAAELTQLLNVAFGNVSLMPGVRLERLELPPSLLARFRGPRFGRQGLRRLFGAPERPLVATAVKPMGLCARELAELAHAQALGGIDLIKDDHGLTDQPFAPFKERVARCVEAVEKANRKTGERTIFVANVTAAAGEIHQRARLARQLGAGGLMVAPGLVGLDSLRRLAEDDEVALPILSHPSFLGAFVTDHTGGISDFALFGQITRLAGADVSIFPNYGGRFAFSREECRSIADGSAAPMGQIRPAFVAPAGGMRLESIAEMLATYGRDVVLLIGGALHAGGDLTANCRRFRQLAEEVAVQVP